MNDKFESFHGSYSRIDIQNYFEYIIKKHETLTVNPPINIYNNKIGNRITRKVKTGYYLELFTPETVKLHGSAENKITKAKYGENVPCLEITAVTY